MVKVVGQADRTNGSIFWQAKELGRQYIGWLEEMGRQGGSRGGGGSDGGDGSRGGGSG